MHLSINQTFYLYLSNYLSIPIHLSIFRSIYPLSIPIYHSICLSTILSIYLSIYTNLGFLCSFILSILSIYVGQSITTTASNEVLASYPTIPVSLLQVNTFISQLFVKEFGDLYQVMPFFNAGKIIMMVVIKMIGDNDTIMLVMMMMMNLWISIIIMTMMIEMRIITDHSLFILFFSSRFSIFIS